MYIALTILHTSIINYSVVTSRDFQGESEVYMFHLLVEVVFLPFYKDRFLKLNLILSSCRVQDLIATEWADCSTKL